MIRPGTSRFLVFAAAFAMLSGEPPRPVPPLPDLYAFCLAAIAGKPGVTCAAGPAPSADPRPGRVPLPTRPATNGREGCVRGPGRPVVGTTTPTLTVTFEAADHEPIEVTFEQEPLDGSQDTTASSTTAFAGEPVVLRAEENGLGPGESYRWRVRGTPWDAAVPGWSDWCEFTVAAGPTDLRGATEVPAVRELGVVPARRYPVTLTVRQWRLVLDATDPAEDGAGVDGGWSGGEQPDTGISALVRARIAGQAAGRRVTVTSTGDEWASTASEVAGTASIWDETFAEEPETGTDGSAYWRVLDRISAELGGPARPSLGYDR